MIKGYYFITDSELSLRGDLADVREAVKAKVCVIQYRSKNTNALQMLEEASRLKQVSGKALFLVNDRVDIAMAVDADGVHLGQEDMPCGIARKLMGRKKIIGISVKTLKEAESAQKAGADYIGLGPVFKTLTKTDAKEPVGLETIRKIRRRISIPLVAIGGIDLDNAAEIIAAGADAVCAISAVVTKPDVRRQILKFQELFSRIPGI